MKPSQVDYSKKKVFISHSSKDAGLVKLLLDYILFLGIGLTEDEVFCTSIDGTGIAEGDEVRNALRAALKNAKIILLILTPNYKMSEVCLNEMGGAWLSAVPVVPLAVRPITYKTVGFLMEVNHVGALQKEQTLSKLRDSITEKCDLKHKKTVIWDAQKATFLEKLEEWSEKNSFPKLISKDATEQLTADKDKALSNLTKLQNEYSKLSRKYEDLKKEKGSEAVKKVEKKHSDETKLQHLEELNSEVASSLKSFSRVIGSLLLSDYFGVPYEIQDWQSYKADVDEAIRKKVINNEGHGDLTVRTEHRDVKDLFSSLSKVVKCISSNEEDEEFSKQYHEEYSSELDCSSQDYWEEHFDFKVVS